MIMFSVETTSHEFRLNVTREWFTLFNPHDTCETPVIGRKTDKAQNATSKRAETLEQPETLR